MHPAIVRRVGAFVVLLLAAAGATAQSVVPSVVRFTGTLAHAAGSATVTFSLHATETGGEPLWTETQAVTVEADGRYTVALGATRPEGLPAGLFADGQARWLGVQVAGRPEQPRALLVSVPYALKAADAESIAGKPLSAFVLVGEKTGVGADGLTYVDTRVLQQALKGAPQGATTSTPNCYARFTDSFGSLGDSVVCQDMVNPATLNFVGVNSTSPQAQLHVTGTKAPAAFFEVISNSLIALPGVYRAARGTPGAPSAVQTGDILGGLAVRGYNGAGWTGGTGQVMFRPSENWTPTANGTYLQFTTTPNGSTGWVERMRINASGEVGVGTTTPRAKMEVYQSSTLAGGLLVETASGGTAVFGLADGANGTGVYGTANSGSYAYGIWGVSSSGYAGWFDGKLHVEGTAQVTGTLTKGGGSFKIDHPLDPERRYLLHSFVESPDMKNVYDGVAVLDENGEAVVTMPGWFGALNRDFRYQLTAVGAPGPNLYIAQEVVDNRFRIAGGRPGAKVSWQVTGTRQDAFANANRIPVELDKPDDEQGTYLHPEAFGQPKEKGLAQGAAVRKRQK